MGLGHPARQARVEGDGPLEAIREFLATHKEFRIDPHYTRFGITSSPDGYLRRLADGETGATRALAGASCKITGRFGQVCDVGPQ